MITDWLNSVKTTSPKSLISVPMSVSFPLPQDSFSRFGNSCLRTELGFEKLSFSHNFSQLNIELCTQAVGNKSGSVNLELMGESNQTRVNESSSGSTEMVSLDSVVKKVGGKIDLLKMDCEGSEWDILKTLNP